MNTIRPAHIASTCAFAIGILAATPQRAPAADRAQTMRAELQKRFAAADANGDGRLTKDEAKGKMPMVYEHFDEIDTAHVGAISMADIAACARARHGERKTAPVAP